MSVREWSPLTANELKSLAAIKLCKGKALIERQLISRLLGERERMMASVQCARWLVEQIQKEEILVCDNLLEPLPIEKAFKALEHSLSGCSWLKDSGGNRSPN